MQVRVARHTNRLAEIVRFYRDGLGLREIGHFKHHDGYDGIFLALTGPKRISSSRRAANTAGPPRTRTACSSSTSVAWTHSARHASASALNRSSRQTRTGRHTASRSSTPTGFTSCSFPTRGYRADPAPPNVIVCAPASPSQRCLPV